MTVTAACKMDLRNYPMDKQNCSLLFESCKYCNRQFPICFEPLYESEAWCTLIRFRSHASICTCFFNRRIS